ncbi:MAG: hypothetical protein ACI8QC_004519, partial [Planctomycetota bacterium]
MKSLIPLIPLLLLSACTLPPTTQAQQSVVPPGGWDMGLVNSDGVLYGRDGTPVGMGVKPGVSTSTQPLNHSLDSNGGSRTALLDMYQAAVNDRDALEMELALMDQERNQFINDSDRLNARIIQLEADNARLMTGGDLLKAQAFELAERLATAQLRRLEAEKALLERTVQEKQAA